MRDKADTVKPQDSVNRPEIAQTPNVAVYVAPSMIDGKSVNKRVKTATILTIANRARFFLQTRLLNVAKIKKLISGANTIRYNIK